MAAPRLRLVHSQKLLKIGNLPQPQLEPSAERVALLVKSGRFMQDSLFDRFLPADLRQVSSVHWTTLEVTQQIAEWLTKLKITSVVDLGSGVGKFCIATALRVPTCCFLGIEQRTRLVEIARSLASTLGVTNQVRFVEGAFDHVTIPKADAYYLYNPFGENLICPEEQVDHDVELSQQRYIREVATMTAFLDSLALGTYVIYNNGFGGTIPPGYFEVFAHRNQLLNVSICRKEE
jgi:predicted RNA methylase